MEEKVIDILAEVAEKDKTEITRETKLVEDLELESLDIVTLVAKIEEEFKIDIPDEEIQNLLTVGDAIKFIEKNAA
jgi:acyl carrier protein